MKIQFLGIGGAMNTASISTSLLIDDKLLIDAPPAIPSVLNRHNCDMQSISDIFITHLHGDHYFGLIFLMLEYFLSGRSSTINIYGDSNLLDNLQSMLSLAYPEMNITDVLTRGKIAINSSDMINSGSISKKYKIELTPCSHSGFKNNGIIIDDGNTSIYYSSDTDFFDEMEAYIKKCPIIILDGTTKDFSLSGHMSYRTIEALAQKYEQKKFYVVHRSMYECKNPSNVILPTEGECIYI